MRFTYSPEGRITSWTDRNDSTFRYVYDAEGRVVSTAGPRRLSVVDVRVRRPPGNRRPGDPVHQFAERDDHVRRQPPSPDHGRDRSSGSRHTIRVRRPRPSSGPDGRAGALDPLRA
ncbi:RHS repeat domain-containing protein [Streptomyces sp. NPDC014746]|uniref:RHS repeat domain-containing protein n=1 Tax=Streptomyces sp. NPDC014746 TaxID=3364904 RepID=UPI0036F9DF84